MMEKEERSHRDSADRSLHREEKVTLFQYDDDGGALTFYIYVQFPVIFVFPPFIPGCCPVKRMEARL